MSMPPSWTAPEVAPERTAGYAESVEDINASAARVRFATAFVTATGRDEELRQFVAAEALLRRGMCSTRELVEALEKAGAFAKGPASTSCRVALQSSLLVATSKLGTEVTLQLLADLCDTWRFDQLTHEGVDLLTRLTLLAYDSGYQMRLQDAASERMLATSFFLRFLQWGYRKEASKETQQEILDFAQNALTNVLLHHPALSELLPAISAHALTLAVERCEGDTTEQAAGRCSKVLAAVALAAAGIAAAQHGPVPPDTAVAVLCSAFPRVGAVAPFDHDNKEYWVSALVDALCLFLKLPDAEIGGREVATLWSRLVVRPVFGLSVTFAAGQYFKLAFLAQPSPSATILAPFLAAPNPPHEVSLAFSSLYRRSQRDDKEEEPPAPPRLFPQDRDVASVSPPRLTQPPTSTRSDGDENPSEVAGHEVPVKTKRDDVAEALENAELISSSSLEDMTPLGRSGRVKLLRKASQAVVLKAFTAQEKDSCLQEVRALQKLNQHPHVISLLKVLKSGDGTVYLELPFCARGSMVQWCEKFGPSILQGDPDTFVRCLYIWRQIWQAIGHLHMDCVYHGRLTLAEMLLTADLRPVLTNFQSSLVNGKGKPTELRVLLPDYIAPELEVQASIVPTAASDVYSAGVAMAKAFMGVELQVSSCLYHPTRGQRSLPEERADVDVVDLLQQLLAEKPSARPQAATVAAHRALDPAGFLRRRGLLGHAESGRSRAQAFLESAEALREEYRGRRVDEPLMFSREAVFEAVSTSKVGEWREDALLGEWRVMLNDESGVDGGGLRREVVSLFFEQLEKSSLVMRAGMDGSEVVTLFINDRRRADKSPQQWRQIWTSVGAMLLRALVHFGNAPLAFSSAVFDCALGRLCKLPPDDLPGGDEDDVDMASVDRMLQLQEEKGDDWARSELLDLLRRLRRADPQKEAGYRWMLSQRMQEERNGLTVNALSIESLETITAMLELRSSTLLGRLSSPDTESVVLPDASLEWVLLWDIYLKFLGGGDRWLAYETLADGFTAHGRRQEMWSAMTGDQVIETLEGVSLTADVILPNLEFKPNYGYETQIQFFKNIIADFNSEELSMFLRFSTGIGRLPASRRFPAGQKLTVRFMPDELEHLPSAHTCFWVVDVPPYEDQEDMAKKLRIAIAAPQPFALS